MRSIYTTMMGSIMLRVRRVRDSCVTVFTFCVYVETKGIIVPGDISNGRRAMPHIIHLDFLLPFIVYFLFYIFYSVDTSIPPVESR